MARKRDLKQWREACREAGLTEAERFEASKDLHQEKVSGALADFTYPDLLEWLREWKAHGN
jgi:hypothetical protein